MEEDLYLKEYTMVSIFKALQLLPSANLVFLEIQKNSLEHVGHQLENSVQRIELIRWLEKELRVKNAEDWYRVSQKQISQMISSNTFQISFRTTT